MTRWRFTTRTAAPTWEDGLVVGSGRIGAIAYGPADALTIALAHERFLLPVNPRPDAPDLTGVLPEMRARILAGDGSAAANLLESAANEAGYDGLVWTDPLAVCATLAVASPGGVTDAVRSIDLRRGTATIAWADDRGGERRVTLVAPRGTDSVWIALESDLAAEVTLRLGLDPRDDGPAASFAPDYSGRVTSAVAGGRIGRLELRDAHGERLARVRATGARSWDAGDPQALVARVIVPAGGRTLLRLDVEVAGSPVRPADDADWDAILRDQTRLHRELVEASTLQLEGREGRVVEEIWDRAAAGDPAARRRAIEIAYAAGRSHIIAATGELPPTLQGVWQGTFTPAWSADYTLNGNVQNGGIAGLIPTGTPELAASLLELILPFADHYRANARRVFGADGMLLPSRMSTHGKADHFNARFPHLFWTGCGGWVLRVIADLVSVTGDRSLVDDRVWELVDGVLRFAETATVSRDGLRHFVPSYSPENTPSDAESSLASDSTADVAIHRDAARAAAVLARARGDEALEERWTALVDALPDYRIADDGTLAEWIGQPWRENHAHRHATQLYPLWYEVDPAFTGPGERAARLREAARATIRAKIAWRAADPTPPPGRMEMSFGLVQLGLASAALGDADDALRCVEWLAVDHVAPALTTRHDAGRIFNLDASGGLPALVAAMLLGSTADTLTVLPALPESWPTGRVTGLRGRGGVVVDVLEWDGSSCALELRRLDAAEWLCPDGRVRLLPGSGFRCEDPRDEELTLRAGESATVRLVRARAR